MLFLISRRNHTELQYRGGQDPLIHLEADLYETVSWANQSGSRWAFTLSNAGAYYFEDRNDLSYLHELDWGAIQATLWSGNTVSPTVKENKQSEFLVERRFPWELVTRIGVNTQPIYRNVVNTLNAHGCRTNVELKKEWYY